MPGRSAPQPDGGYFTKVEPSGRHNATTSLAVLQNGAQKQIVHLQTVCRIRTRDVHCVCAALLKVTRGDPSMYHSGTLSIYGS